MAIIQKSPFLKKEVERIHLKDEYYAIAKEEYIKLLKALAIAHVNVTQQMRESIISDIKSHYKSVQGF